MLESYIGKRLDEKEILLMTHIVLGYPSFDHNFGMVAAMAAAGVDLMELQIPFSEPTADGPVIAHANQKALESGVTVTDCLKLAHDLREPRSFQTTGAGHVGFRACFVRPMRAWPVFSRPGCDCHAI